MKKVLLSLVCMIVALGASAQTEKGFRAMVDLGYTISTSDLEIYDGYNTYKADISNRFMATVTGGYQICPEFFVGVGTGIQYWHQSDDGTIAVPIFADVRYDMRLDSRWGFFADIRAGYTVNKIDGFYMSPYVGARYALTEKLGLNLGLGYEMQKVKDVDGSCGGFAIKLGVDF